jgi:hypothetical protein
MRTTASRRPIHDMYQADSGMVARRRRTTGDRIFRRPTRSSPTTLDRVHLHRKTELEFSPTAR